MTHEYMVILDPECISTKDKKLTAIIGKALSDRLDVLISAVSPEQANDLIKHYYLGTIDRLWIDHIDAMQQLRDKV